MSKINIFIGSSIDSQERVNYIKNGLFNNFDNRIHIHYFLDGTSSSPVGLQTDADNYLKQKAHFAVFIISQKISNNILHEIKLATTLFRQGHLLGVYLYYLDKNYLQNLYENNIIDTFNPFFIAKHYQSDDFVRYDIINQITQTLNYDEIFIEFDFEKIRSEIESRFGEFISNYVRRVSYENDIKEKLLRDNKNVALVGCRGMGGIGKTVLALKVIKDLLDFHYINGVLWIEITKESTKDELLNNSFKKMIKSVKKIKQLNPLQFQNISIYKFIKNENFINIAARKLSRENIVVVVDSAEQNEETSKYLKNFFAGKGISILITSRKIFKGISFIEIYTMNDNEAIKLFKKHCSSCSNEELIVKICERLGYHPLAIEFIANKSEILGIEEVYKQLIEKGIEFIKDDDADDERYKDFINQVIRIHYEPLDENSKKIFLTLSLLSEFSKEKLIKEHKEIWEIDYSNNELELFYNLEKLIKNSLIKKEENYYYLHPLIREFALKELENILKESSIELKSKIIKALLQVYNDSNWEFIRNNFLDIEDVLEYKRKDLEYLKEMIKLLDNFLFSEGYVTLLIKYYDILNEKYEVAWHYCNNGDYNKALPYLKEVLNSEELLSTNWIWPIYLLSYFIKEEKKSEYLLFLYTILRYLIKENKWNEINIYLKRVGKIYEEWGYKDIALNYYISALKIKLTINKNKRNILVSYDNIINNLIDIDPNRAFLLAKQIKTFIEDKKNNEIYGYLGQKLVFLYYYTKIGILTGKLSKSEIEKNLEEIKKIEEKFGKNDITLYLNTLYNLFNKNFEEIKGYEDFENNEFLSTLIKALNKEDFEYLDYNSKERFANKLFFEGVKSIEKLRENLIDKSLLLDVADEAFRKIFRAKKIKEDLGIYPHFELWYLKYLKDNGIEVNEPKIEYIDFRDNIDILK